MKKVLLMILVVTVVFSMCSFAQNSPSVDDIVKKANLVAYYKGADGKAKVSMTIKDSQGRTSKKEFTILRRDSVETDESDTFDGDQKFYVYFHLPADVNKMGFLVWKHVKSDDDRWLYLPALDLVKRIAATEKRTSFVGSDFFYEDVSGRNLVEDTHKLIETTKDYFVVDNVPKDPKTVEFSHYKMWIHKESFITVKVEYYDKQNEKYREYQALKVDRIQGYPTVTKAVMKDIKAGSETVLNYSKIVYNIELPDNIFSERYLRKAPAKFLR